MEQLCDRVAVVTGGANGMGLGIARALGAEGMKVVIADVDAALLDAARGLRNGGVDVTAVRADVSDPAAVEHLLAETLARYGAVHVLCNNAGVGGLQRTSTLTLDAWRWQLGVNLWGVIHGVTTFLPVLLEQDEAHVVSTASMAGVMHGPYLAPYNVSKAGVVALSETLWQELAIDHPQIGVSVLCPGPVATTIADDERNRPAGLASRRDSDPAMNAARETLAGVMAAGLSIDEVGAIVVDGIRARRLHLWTHPEWLVPAVKPRFDAILGQRNPALPSAEQLRAMGPAGA